MIHGKALKTGGFAGGKETLGGAAAICVCIRDRERMLELYSDDIFVKPFHWSSISQVYTRVLHAQDFPRIMAMDVFCNVY